MSDHSTHFEGAGSGLILTNAILLYQSGTFGNASALGASRQAGPAFASIHAIEHQEEGQPMIGAGASLTRAHLRQWTEVLGRTVRPEILPDNVLVAHPDILAWWVPGQVRPAYFALSLPPEDLQVLSTKTVLPVPYPAHLFVATRFGLGVYALPANRRPTAETPLLYSPILNIFIGGQLCWGNIPRPKTLSIASIPEFESAVFNSWSTHANQGQELTVTGKGGLVRLWDDLAARRATRFPVRRLKPFKPGVRGRSRQMPEAAAVQSITVGDIIRASAR